MQFNNPLEEEFYEKSKKNAVQTGYRLNPDYDVVVIAVKGITNNKK